MTNVMTVQNFEVMFWIFHTVGIFIIGNAQKCVAKIMELCSICFSQKEFCFLGYDAMESSESQMTYWRNKFPPSSGSKSKLSKKPAWSR
jgi:23S rRNA C2498 (ribose-2'-O)-methylase RlmM